MVLCIGFQRILRGFRFLKVPRIIRVTTMSPMSRRARDFRKVFFQDGARAVSLIFHGFRLCVSSVLNRQMKAITDPAQSMMTFPFIQACYVFNPSSRPGIRTPPSQRRTDFFQPSFA